MLTQDSREKISNRPAMYGRPAMAKWLAERYGLAIGLVEELLPPIIVRSKWDEIAERTGLPLTSKSLANLDSKGLGPERLA